jgi:hypothetical protein
MDHKGDGLFRGRFGTMPAGHSQGEPVILFPFRYWDRWASRADAPELAYFTLSIDQPSAYWDSCFFVKEDADSCQVGVLQKDDPDAPWDADPDNDSRLHVYWKGDIDGRTIPIGKQSDRIDWRVFVKYSGTGGRRRRCYGGSRRRISDRGWSSRASSDEESGPFRCGTSSRNSRLERDFRSRIPPGRGSGD